MADVRVQWTGEEYAQTIAGLLPDGTAWPKGVDSELMAWCRGCGEIWGSVSARAAALLITESDPRATLEMLPEWERAFGLPDACVAEPLTITDRRKALVTKMVSMGGQSRAFFIAVGAALGYQITIQEFSPWMFGVSRCGDTRSAAPQDASDVYPRWVFGPPEIRFLWKVHITGAKTRWFRFGTGQFGADPMVRIGLATDLECLIRRWKPGHTQVLFDYSGAANTGRTTYNYFQFGKSHFGSDHMVAVTTTGGIQDT